LEEKGGKFIEIFKYDLFNFQKVSPVFKKEEILLVSKK